ncbi:MAG: glycosyltransferase family 2 protein [Gemmatimonadales bacterium]
MKITVIVPTFRRPGNLLRCLDALKRQRVPAQEVLVAIRDDDPVTWATLMAWDHERLPLRLISAGLLDASEARNRCLDRATGDLIALTDDDAAPRPQWLAQIERRFAQDPGLGALGGPDWIGGRELPPEHRAQVVGKIQWWGRRIGNHHRGSAMPLRVEWLKGANVAFRREALGNRRFGHLLRGTGAQFGEDVAVSLELGAAGWVLEYDPDVAVDHFPGELPGGADHRTLADPASLLDASHNETAVLLGYLMPARRIAFLLWATLVGTRLLPGILMGLFLTLTLLRLAPLRRSRVVLRGRLEGWRTWRAAQPGPTHDLTRVPGRRQPAPTA